MKSADRQRERREIYLRRGDRFPDLVREGFIRFGIYPGGKLNPKPEPETPIPSVTAGVDAPTT